jgi:transketolase
MSRKSLASRAADNIRVLSAAMVERAKSGHPGGAMGGADFIQILFSEFLRFDPDDPAWPLRDRFFLDPGHMSPMLYAELMMTGLMDMEDLRNFRQWKSRTPGHPELDIHHGIENTSGPLGQGHVMAVGAAITERFLAARFGEWMEHKTFAFLSDGSIQEEIAQGAGRIAGHLGLGNLVMFFDSNEVQLSTLVNEVTSEDTALKYEAWHWHVQTIDGNDEKAIRKALKNALAESERPSLIIGKTRMGYGALSEDGGKMEGLTSTHGQPLSKAGVSIEKTIRNLGGDTENPFQLFPEVEEFYEKVLEQKREAAAQRRKTQKSWEIAYPDLAVKWHTYFNGKLPLLDFSTIPYKADGPTRNASGAVLSWFSEHIDNMIVMSADLSNSDKTEGFLKNSKPFVKGDFSGGFLHVGVSELTMATLANGVALHGGVYVACGTFFVFSDYMKPAIRMAALMEIPVKYLFTHDTFRVGEDGPTHQPVEQEAQIRLLEQIKNHSGNHSMLVLRPADFFETLESWKMAMENTSSPTALLLSRQKVIDIPSKKGFTREKEAMECRKGAYIIQHYEKPDVILVANGSEVSTLMEASKILKHQHNINSRVVSAISEGLFRQQPENYQKEVIPAGIPVFGLTAGIPITLQCLVGAQGQVFGLDRFGKSAPFQVLDEKFGFTAEKVADEVLEFLHLRGKV